MENDAKIAYKLTNAILAIVTRVENNQQEKFYIYMYNISPKNIKLPW